MKWLSAHVVQVLAAVTVLLAVGQLLHWWPRGEWWVLVGSVVTLLSTFAPVQAVAVMEVKLAPQKKDEKSPGSEKK